MTVAPQQSPQQPGILQAQLDRNKLLAAVIQKLGSLGIQLGAKSSTATAGSATLPSAPVGFVTVTFSDGSSGKVPYYNT